MQELERLKEKAIKELFPLQFVKGVAVRHASEPTLVIYVNGKDTATITALANQLPQTIDGVRVIVRNIGDVRLLSSIFSFPSFPLLSLTRSRVRPLQAGVSVSSSLSLSSTTGTLGMILPADSSSSSNSNSSNKAFLISNAHVLASSLLFSNISTLAASQGFLIQPGLIDGGNIQNKDDIVYVENNTIWYVPYKQQEQNNNTVDLAFAIIENNAVTYQVADSINSYKIYSTVFYDDLIGVNDVVHKVGRTTGYTSANVIDTNATIKVQVGNGSSSSSSSNSSSSITQQQQQEVIFTDVIMTEAMARAGDSGSGVFTLRRVGDNVMLLPAGLVFAGSDQVTLVIKFNNIVNMINTFSKTTGYSLGIKPLSTALQQQTILTTGTSNIEQLLPYITITSFGLQILTITYGIVEKIRERSSSSRGGGVERRRKGESKVPESLMSGTKSSSCKLCKMLREIAEKEKEEEEEKKRRGL